MAEEMTRVLGRVKLGDGKGEYSFQQLRSKCLTSLGHVGDTYQKRCFFTWLTEGIGYADLRNNFASPRSTVEDWLNRLSVDPEIEDIVLQMLEDT